MNNVILMSLALWPLSYPCLISYPYLVLSQAPPHLGAMTR